MRLALLLVLLTSSAMLGCSRRFEVVVENDSINTVDLALYLPTGGPMPGIDGLLGGRRAGGAFLVSVEPGGTWRSSRATDAQRVAYPGAGSRLVVGQRTDESPDSMRWTQVRTWYKDGGLTLTFPTEASPWGYSAAQRDGQSLEVRPVDEIDREELLRWVPVDW
ncbi:MAG: hypothetical protein KDA05_08345 [Phycisphaerales bacterium]|nr:hypothetical protein [Phycisphaerales bacterium]MCB9841242.1 hypothetical protein [Phycisphaeraceae bacterium]